MEPAAKTRRDFLIGMGLGALAGGAASAGTRESSPVVHEKPRETRVVHECDICVVGGSCTGVFAAIRAARVYEKSNPSRYAVFNSAEMMMELDHLVGEHKPICPFLHALFVDGVAEGGRMSHAIIEDKSGRRAVKARLFIDATGDADVLTRIGLPVRKDEVLQPPRCAPSCRAWRTSRRPTQASTWPRLSIIKNVSRTRWPQASSGRPSR